jgi:5'-nucleotidase / UDP-sugar diphosphatase
VSRRAVLILLLSATGCMGNAPPPIPLKPVRFLLINDVSVADTTPDGRGGLARVATVRNRLADQGPILFVLAGNALSSSEIGKVSGGRGMVEVLNAAKLDYATFGNHEFDLPLDTLTARISESRFKWISSNCTLAQGGPLPKVISWDTLRVSGHKVGMFGITVPGPYPAYVRCSNPDTAAQRVIQTLTDEGADLIVGITHQSMAADRELLGREPRLDLILGGHDQAAQDSIVSNRHVVKADENARSAQFVTLWGGKGKWRQATGLVPIDAALPPDTATARVVSAWSDSLQRGPGSEQGSIAPARSQD